MSYTTNYGGYVKFLRGTPTAWAKILDSEKNTDTLYFISEPGSTTGKLYLGPKLISNSDLTSATSIKDLNDVLLGEGITDNSLLVYNATTQKWENKSLLDIFVEINEVFTGATADTAGTAGLVPAPTAGQEGLFLKGDGTWADPNTGLEELTNVINGLIGEDTGKTIREIAADEASTKVAEIVNGAPESFDTLKEIADWITQHQDVADLVTIGEKVNNLEDIINGTPADGDTPAVPGLVQNVNSLEERVVALEEDMSDVKDALRWQDIVEEDAP